MDTKACKDRKISKLEKKLKDAEATIKRLNMEPGDRDILALAAAVLEAAEEDGS